MPRISVLPFVFGWLLLACLTHANATQILAENADNANTFDEEFNHEITLEVGSSKVITSPDKVNRVALVKPEIAEARLINEAELMIMALQVGQTDVLWWLENGKRERIRVQVHEGVNPVLDTLLSTIEENNPGVSVIWQQGKPLITGQVDEPSFQRLLQLKEEFPGISISQVDVSAEKVATLELEVKVYEINRRSLRQLGLRWQQSIAGPSLGVISDWYGGGAFRALSESGMNSLPNQESLLSNLPTGQHGYIGWAASFASTLKLMQERGEGRVLATPKLRVESGETAEFLAGGEIPIPQTTLQGATQVDFKNYGIYLKVAPVKLADGRIRTQVISELSQPDSGIAVQGVPGLKTRRTETMVTVAEGETLVIAGLVSQENSEMRSGLPGLSNGVERLLSSRDEQSQETELVVFITPRDLQTQTLRNQQSRKKQEQLWRAFSAIGCTGMTEFTGS